MTDNPFEISNAFETPSSEPTPQQMPFGGSGNSNSMPSGGNTPFNNSNKSWSQGGGNSNNGQKRKYKFVQMYFLINPKLFANQQLSQGEVPIMEISYNVDYSNLRLTFSNAKNDSFSKTSIKIMTLDRPTTVNIYPEIAEQLLFNLENWKANKIQVFERMLQSSASWSPNFTLVQIDPTTQTVTINTRPEPENGSMYTYTFSEWQLNAFTNALKFLVNGSAWNLEMARFLTAE